MAGASRGARRWRSRRLNAGGEQRVGPKVLETDGGPESLEQIAKSLQRLCFDQGTRQDAEPGQVVYGADPAYQAGPGRAESVLQAGPDRLQQFRTRPLLTSFFLRQSFDARHVRHVSRLLKLV